ncbi:MAG: hypothetical protein QM708_12065 [Propioniciclava sp.]|uniref:hypothetical protein n=1 Tax=Propioniciclava sp. TaxID=2038686 RepID=UPI0039E473BA
MWADAEKMTLDYLAAALPGRLDEDVVLSTTVPSPLPDCLVRVMSSGSERRTIVHRDSRITVECWWPGDESRASRLAEIVYETLDEWELLPAFDGWPSGPYPQPDPTTGCPRYVMTCVVRHRTET